MLGICVPINASFLGPSNRKGGFIMRCHVAFAVEWHRRWTEIGPANHHIRSIQKHQKQQREAADLENVNDHPCHDISNRKSREMIKTQAETEGLTVMGDLGPDGGR
jgi:hypothetical protein